MTEAEFQENFPNGLIPEPLKALLAFQNRAQECYSGRFELTHWPYENPAWFAGDRATARQFAVFGAGPDGSLYALWLYAGRRMDNAPVVFLGSEGTECSVIADNLDRFLSLLGIGAEELGFDIAWGEVAEANPPARRLKEFRAWLAKTAEVDPVSDPMALVVAARDNHPDLTAWLETWQALHA